MASAFPFAAPTKTPSRVGDPQSAGGRGAGLTNRLPTWADTAEARRLIAAIVAEQPTRTTHDAMGFKVRQYNGRNAAQLRAIFDRAFATMCEWVDEARVATPRGVPMRPADRANYDQRRETVVEWGRVFSADALIQRLLGDAS